MEAELVFIPVPVPGHLSSAIELAKLLVRRDNRLSIKVLIMKSSNSPPTTAASDNERIRIIELPSDTGSDPANMRLNELIAAQKPYVKNYVSRLIELRAGSNRRLAGLVIDMFCTSMIDVADELGVPAYLYYTSSAAFLALQFHAQSLHDGAGKWDVDALNEPGAELTLPGLVNPVPAKCIPSVMLNKDWIPFVLGHARRFRETKGILVNTFTELESNVLKSFSGSDNPTIYPVGPVLSLESDNPSLDIMEWLDAQPPSSVVFLCFGSLGAFDEEQVREIAEALESCGHKFLWSLRRPPPKGLVVQSTDYSNFNEVLPEGFLDRTIGFGKVIGWAPQVSILAHPAIGGFVTHCGWNSMLESLWFGVLTATWPLHAEQQFNAFMSVVELELSAEIRMDYRKDFLNDNPKNLTAEEIEKGIMSLMEPSNERRKTVKEMSKFSRLAVLEGGSSYVGINRFIEDMFHNIP